MTAPDQYCINVKKLLGTSKNSASSPNAIKLPANDSASFSFRFIYVHSGAVSDRQWEQFFEVPMSLSFDIAEVAQPVPQSLQRRPGFVRKNTDFPKAAGRLRKRSARPRNDRAADKFNKLTPPELTKLHLLPRR